MDWDTATLEEVGAAAAEGAIAVRPVGATEQYGPHLATGTDTTLAAAVSRAAAERTGDVVLPALAYGCSLGHTDYWPGRRAGRAGPGALDRIACRLERRARPGLR